MNISWNIPNILTSLRIILIPVFLLAFFILPYCFSDGNPWPSRISFGIFWVASVTDWFDGYLARKLNQTSPFGAFLDPVADKLMVVFAIICLTTRLNQAYFVIPAAVIIGREIVISALREWMAEYGKRGKVAVSILGKIKTTAQMLALMFLLFNSDLFLFMTKRFNHITGVVLLYVAAILTVVSMIDYLKAAFSEND
ncbi:MAG: CDP-diacylglycerol--glycerol-3-phosphate 3-phosphatidyltransferase [Gammaproteobacteria bacterium]|nr:MAG: CDP-diacylglycerol--glycerol-3-phosphate 3-phosphatidyltransferase [Gammaproteobacteria bacterium]